MEFFGASLAKTFHRHTIKFGWDFEHTSVDGVEASANSGPTFRDASRLTCSSALSTLVLSSRYGRRPYARKPIGSN